MATLTIRNLDNEVKAALRIEAARHGRSMEEEVRVILKNAIVEAANGGVGFGSRVRRHFADVSIEEMDLPGRMERPRAAEFPE